MDLKGLVAIRDRQQKEVERLKGESELLHQRIISAHHKHETSLEEMWQAVRKGVSTGSVTEDFVLLHFAPEQRQQMREHLAQLAKMLVDHAGEPVLVITRQELEYKDLTNRHANSTYSLATNYSMCVAGPLVFALGGGGRYGLGPRTTVGISGRANSVCHTISSLECNLKKNDLVLFRYGYFDYLTPATAVPVHEGCAERGASTIIPFAVHIGFQEVAKCFKPAKSLAVPLTMAALLGLSPRSWPSDLRHHCTEKMMAQISADVDLQLKLDELEEQKQALARRQAELSRKRA